MFYHFHQNNSGGNFAYDDKLGIAPNVIVEADSVAEANDRALDIGLYFDGVSNGRDCSCCGDRWYPVSSDQYDGKPFPHMYGSQVNPGDNFPAKDEKGGFHFKWMGDGMAEGFIHYKDGRIEPFHEHQNERKDLDGSYGYGVQFTRNYVDVFLVGKNGWAEDGNRQAANHPSRQGTLGEWVMPDGPTVELVRGYGWGKAWFPTADEADEFAAQLSDKNNAIWDAVRSTVRKERKDIDTVLSEALSIWRKDA